MDEDGGPYLITSFLSFEGNGSRLLRYCYEMKKREKRNNELRWTKVVVSNASA